MTTPNDRDRDIGERLDATIAELREHVGPAVRAPKPPQRAVYTFTGHWPPLKIGELVSQAKMNFWATILYSVFAFVIATLTFLSDSQRGWTGEMFCILFMFQPLILLAGHQWNTTRWLRHFAQRQDAEAESQRGAS